MVQDESLEEKGDDVTSLKEIKKSRRTVMFGSALKVDGNGGGLMAFPLTPPLSERASGSTQDGRDMFGPEREERYESVDLSSEDGLEWEQSDRDQSSSMTESEEVVPLSSYLIVGFSRSACTDGRGKFDDSAEP